MIAAVDTVRRRAREETPAALVRLAAHGLGPDADDLAARMRHSGRLTLNFHPDRIDRHGRTVASGLLADGRYRNQYETGISNGGRSAVDGGSRPSWETQLFGTLAADVTERPIYGAFDITCDPHGGSPRFGSSFLVLHSRCMERATFCMGDSHVGPTDVGTIDELTPVLAGLADDAATGDGLDRGLSIGDLRRAISGPVARPARSLDGYIEAQVHGGVDLATDVVELVLDPSFGGTDVEADLTTAAERHGFAVRHHRGSELARDDVPSDFRGAAMPGLAHGAARHDGMVDAAAIGRAISTEPFSPPLPHGDPDDSPRQRYKQLWHCVLRFGADARRPGLVD